MKPIELLDKPEMNINEDFKPSKDDVLKFKTGEDLEEKPPKKSGDKDNTIMWVCVIVVIVIIGLYLYNRKAQLEAKYPDDEDYDDGQD